MNAIIKIGNYVSYPQKFSQHITFMEHYTGKYEEGGEIFMFTNAFNKI